jgi:hypothetical protein
MVHTFSSYLDLLEIVFAVLEPVYQGLLSRFGFLATIQDVLVCDWGGPWLDDVKNIGQGWPSVLSKVFCGEYQRIDSTSGGRN